ncbi:MAG: BlaI/MecI/CopY family transcriptional regulator [Bacteroidota bacterium]
MTKNKNIYQDLSKRERQIMDVVMRLSEASAQEIQERLPDPPSYSSVRALLSIMVNKGYLTHRNEGKKYIYAASTAKETVKASAVKNLITNLFDGSASSAISTILNLSSSKLSEEDYQRLKQMIEDAEKKQ